MMRARDHAPLPDLFDAADASPRTSTELATGAVVLHAFALDVDVSILAAIAAVSAAAPFRQLSTPGGHLMSVAMTNCGLAGWITDARGYRYTATDPLSGRPWPPMPPDLSALAQRAATSAGWGDFNPDACLVNRYEPGARMSLHQDRDERELLHPIVSVSLGLPARFLFGGLARTDRVQRVTLAHGDVVVWGGAARLAFHGVDALRDGTHPLTGRCRINLTFRVAR